ncbi:MULTISPECIES: ABC transporter permease [unclassified Fusibacter]|uniref:ABC transporter permease n=1 Tax=unclassified Fusibacter TaxID=2624464 RepID=UPI001012C419|nr:MULTISPECIES: ABC transporter permease [unclassified Fusibacter]MCK8059338.1 ABC transporter permease [Fusibacter sp. A2]NPE21198.1 ABC transporter permease [Fusibacter sp. A1]RXV62466.1 ABC transporter permease [Fusibacter sp. A1]
MLRYTLERIVYGALSLWLIVTVTFLLLQMLPGSPFQDDKLTAEQVAILNEKYGLNDPLPMQYWRYMTNMLKGDFGKSFMYDNQDVLKDLVVPRWPRTIKVGSLALSMGVVIGIILGALAALNRGKFYDNFIVFLAVLGVSIPSFVFAMGLQYYLGVKLPIFPVLYEDGNFWSIILPAVSMAVGPISSLTRFVRTELVEVIASDYILLARAKGLTRTQVIFRHALRNALIPVVTIVGPMVLSLLNGGVIMENIFGIPGVGQLMVSGITLNDYFIVLTVSTLFSGLFIAVVLVVDLLYGVIDPRIRIAGGN